MTAPGWAYQDAIERANELFERFHAKEPDADYLLDLQWPEDGRFGVLDYATITSYWSDKWNDDGDWEPYKHPHPRIDPVILVPYEPGMRLYGRVFRRPVALTYLGYAMDVQLRRPEGEDEFINFSHLDDLPYLAADPSRCMLVVIDQDTMQVYVLWSPDLRVTERGIEG